MFDRVAGVDRFRDPAERYKDGKRRASVQPLDRGLWRTIACPLGVESPRLA